MKKDINIFKIIFILWGLIILGYELSLADINLKYISNNHGYIRLIMLLIFICIIIEYFIFKTYADKWGKKEKALMIFLIALLARILSLPFSQYIPSNDFRVYFEGACHFANNGFSESAYEALMSYHIPEFAGQSVINGFFLSILSPTLLGMQILNSIYTSGICLFIYLFGEKINTNVATMGGILYTFYPDSILSTHITTNHHGATFFFLLGLYLFEAIINNNYKKTKKIFVCLISSICFVLSNFYHPSVIIVLCAILITAFINELEQMCHFGKIYISIFFRELRNINNRILLTIIIIILYETISVCSLSILKNLNYVENVNTTIPIGKIVVGLNQETSGGWCRSDYAYIDSLPEEEKLKEGIKIIKERLKDPIKVFTLMVKKTSMAWFEPDNYRYFYTDGILNELNQKINATSDLTLKNEYSKQILNIDQITDNISLVDTIYTNFLWLFALLGICKTIKMKEKITFIHSLLFVPIGWMLFITFTEMQGRYRYQGMPAVTLLAALGINCICNNFRKNNHL